MSAKTETRPALTISRTTVRTGVRVGTEDGLTSRCYRPPVFTTTVHGYTQVCR